MNKQIVNFNGCDCKYLESDIVIFGVPFDGTVSYRPGTRFAPAEIRNQSIGIETYSPYFDKEIFNYNIFDYGDLELPFGNTEKVLNIIENHTKKIFEDKKIPVAIGGEHLISLPLIKQAHAFNEDLIILHFDAHTDLWDHYMGEKLSHATVIKRAWEIVGDNKIFQFGIRSGEKAGFDWAKKHTTMVRYDFHGLEEIIEKIKNKPVYLTIDLDILDPSIFPGTGTPEPGGIFFNDMMKIIKLISKLNIVGADMVELSPHYDSSGVSTIVACKVLRELLISMSCK